MRSSEQGSGSSRVGLARPVWINLERLFTTEGDTRADQLSLDGEVPGTLHEWHRSSRGEWLGVVSFDIHTGAGETVSFLRQLLPQDVIRHRSYGP
jgi:hypothetical protein